MQKDVKEYFSFTKTQTFQKWVALGVFLIILLLLPLLVFEVKQRQNVTQHAAFSSHQQYACGGNIVISLDAGLETPDCSTGVNALATSYKSSVVVSATGANLSGYTVHWKWSSFWCNSGATSGSCTSGEKPISGTFNLSTQPQTVSSFPMTPATLYTGQACGFYQNDFGFYVTDTSGTWVCGLSDISNLGSKNNFYSSCHTGNVCTTVVTPTPTNSPTPTDTPIPSLSPTLTPTDTPTPGLTITPTDTPTPTTPNVPTDTPTPGVTTIITPTPTIPSTGPGDTFVGVGVVGLVIAVVGLGFAIGL